MQHDLRRLIFTSNLDLINKHNIEHGLGLHSFTLGVNRFADLTNEEFVKQYNGFFGMSNLPVEDVKVNGNLPDTVDWRNEVNHK